MPDGRDREHAELLAVFQATTDDLERAKQWGWQLTYQAVLAQFGVVWLRQQYPCGGLISVAFFAVLLVVSAVAVTYIESTQTSIVKFRHRIDRCRERLPAVDKIFGERPVKRKWHFSAVVVGSGAFAAVLTFWPW